MADDMVSNVEQWVSFTDEALKDASAWHDTVDTIIFGHNNYAPNGRLPTRVALATGHALAAARQARQ
jgi:hypothetical protein